jgi:hypothetical protein
MPSTVIAYMHYNPETLVLKIGFVSGLVYEYLNVPLHVYNELKSSGSKGTYFNQHIKGYYDYKKITAASS